MPKQHPILFSTPMVQAILEGRKTQTRRSVKPQPPEGATPSMPQVYVPVKIKADGEMVEGAPVYGTSDLHGQNWGVKCPYGQPGDVLWVRETFIKSSYATDLFYFKTDKGVSGAWKPSIHMPKDIARIWLEVTEVKVERLHAITDEDAIAEGCDKSYARGHFYNVWQDINGALSWGQNPYVWVVKFKVLSTTGKPKNLN